MAGPGVVISHATAATPTLGSLFDGKSFFIAQRVPSRSSYIDKVQSNGGRIVRLENSSDFLIADHLRRDSPPGSISYTFIDAAIRDSALPDPKDHRAGPGQGTTRAVGSSVVPPRGTRTPFTAQDDWDLWNWVQTTTRAGKGTVKGNEIYKQLEAVNPRHTFQAWRDRYVKKLMDRPPEGVDKAGNEEHGRETGTETEQIPKRRKRQNGVRNEQEEQAMTPELQEVEEPAEEERDMGPLERQERHRLKDDDNFRMNGLDGLLENAKDIQNVSIDNYDDAWIAWAGENKELTSEGWRKYYQEIVLPIYQERRKLDRLKAATERQSEQLEALSASRILERVPSEDEPQADSGTDGKQEAAGPSSQTQKRKRQTPTPRKQAYGNKRSRQDIEIFGEQDEEDIPAQHQRQENPRRSLFPQPSAPKDMEGVVNLTNGHDEEDASSDEDLADGEDGMPTSEANLAAREQFIAEADQVDGDDESQADDTLVANDLVIEAPDDTAAVSPSAAADERADEERSEEDHGSQADVEATDAPNRHALLLTEQQEQFSPSSRVASWSPDQPRSQLAAPEGAQPGDMLTEANLASQQQQHKAQLIRGVGLPEDSEEVDESGYAEFSQSLLGVKDQANPEAQRSKPQAEVPDRLMEAAEEEKEGAVKLESDRELSSNSDEMALPRNGEMDVDEAYTHNLDWSMSPEKPNHPGAERQQSQSFAFETQVQYPDLSGQRQQGLEEDEDEMSSQPFGYPELKNTQLPIWRDDEPGFSSQAGIEDDAEGDGAATPKQQQTSHAQDAGPGVNVDLRNGENAPAGLDAPNGGSNQEEEEKDFEIDLSVPEPEGGFPSDDEAEAEGTDERSDVERLKEEQSSNHARGHNATETIEISSQSSSEESSIADEQDRPYSTNPNLHGIKKNADTQAILDAETQQPDLELPLPPDSDSEPELPEYPPRPSTQERERPQFKYPSIDRKASQNPAKPNQTPPKPSPAQPKPAPPSSINQSRPPTSRRTSIFASKPRSTPASTPADAESLDAFLSRLQTAGHPLPSLTRALHMTSMRKPIAEMVVYLLKAGRPLPEDVREIWSENEDSVAVGGDSVALRKLTERKGWDEFEERVRFLGEWGEG